MANFLKNIFSDTTSKLVEKIGEAIDRNVTNKEEKLKAEKDVAKVLLDFELSIDQSVTERHKIDMNSDNKLSKNIRPASFIILFTVVAFISITDGNFWGMNVQPEYIELYKSLLSLMVAFYFGSRGVEKIFKTIKK